MNEGYAMKNSSNDSLTIMLDEKEKGVSLGKGEVFDTIYYPDGRIEKREKSFNVIVKSLSRLLAAFIKAETGYLGGNLFWAMGTGQTSWDTTTYTAVDTAERLTNEVFRKAIPLGNRYFVDANFQRTNTITNRLQIDIILDENEANGFILREFGIFGGNATTVANSGILINHKVHSRIDKVSGMRIERSIRFTFN